MLYVSQSGPSSRYYTLWYSKKLRIVELSKNEWINYEMTQVFSGNLHSFGVGCRCVVVNVRVDYEIIFLPISIHPLNTNTSS
jgi:hypothetical protein